jgi:hypothetical protein
MPAQIVFHNDTQYEIVQVSLWYAVPGSADKIAINKRAPGQRPRQGTVYVRLSDDNNVDLRPKNGKIEQPYSVVPEGIANYEFKFSKHPEGKWVP